MSLLFKDKSQRRYTVSKVKLKVGEAVKQLNAFGVIN